MNWRDLLGLLVIGPLELDFSFIARVGSALAPRLSPARGRLWLPVYVDSLFLPFGFAAALSPADTAPLTPRAKR